MKKIIISLASVALLLTGCYKEEVESLLDDVDSIEGVTIPAMKKQISDIDASVKEVLAADAAIQESIVKIQNEYLPKIEEAAKNIGGLADDVKALKEKEESLQKTVAGLKDYVDNEAASKTWVEGTIANLAKQDEVQKSLSEVNTAIKNINDDIKALEGADEENLKIIRGEITELNNTLLTKIGEVETGIKGWVNEKLDAYYTASKTQENIDSLANSVYKKMSQLSEADEKNALDIAENTKNIQKLGEDLIEVKNEVIDGYTKAIEKAIRETNGEITEALAKDVDKLNTKIDQSVAAINGRIDDLEERVSVVERDIVEIKGRINTIDGQIKSIDSTIVVLKETDQLIKETIASNAALTQKQVDSLKDADAAIVSSIETLTTYVNDTLSGTQDWVKATFTTLEQHDALQLSVTNLKTVVNNIGSSSDTKIDNLSKKIDNLESSMKTWVNGQLQDKYDELNGKITALRTELMGYDSSLKTELLGEISLAKQELKSAITDAIDAALAADGKITAAINAKFAELSQTVSSNFDTLKALIDKLRKDVDANTQSINTITGQIEKIDKTIEQLEAAYKLADSQVKEELNGIITSLRDFVGTLPAGTTQTNVVDWANATFATLAQQTATAGAIQKVKNSLDSLSRAFEAEKGVVDSKIAAVKTAVDTCSANVRTWVSQTLTGYATLGAITTAINNFKDGDLKTILSTEINNAKTEITTAYQQYITNLLENGGQIDQAIKAAVKTVDDKIEGVNGILARLSAAETDIDNLQSDLDALEAAVGETPTGKTVNGLIDELEAEITRIKGTYTGTLQGLDSRITTLENAINGATGLIQKVTAIEGKLAGVSTTVKDLIDNTIATEIAKVTGTGWTKTIKQIEDALAEITKVGGILERLSTAETNITNLKNAVGTTPSGKTVNGLIDELEAEVARIKGTYTGTLAALDTRIKTLEDAVTATNGLVTKVAAIEAKLAGMSNTDTVKSLIAALETSLKGTATAKGDTLGELEARIKDLEDKVTATGALVDKVAALETKLSGIDGTVAAEIAKQIEDAINGLKGESTKTLEEIEDIVDALVKKNISLKYIPDLSNGYGKVDYKVVNNTTNTLVVDYVNLMFASNVVINPDDYNIKTIWINTLKPVTRASAGTQISADKVVYAYDETGGVFFASIDVKSGIFTNDFLTESVGIAVSVIISDKVSGDILCQTEYVNLQPYLTNKSSIINVPTEELVFDANGKTEKSFTIQAEGDWTIAYPDWLEGEIQTIFGTWWYLDSWGMICTYDERDVRFTAEKNTGSERTGEIKITTNSGVSTTIPVKQKAKSSK